MPIIDMDIDIKVKLILEIYLLSVELDDIIMTTFVLFNLNVSVCHKYGIQ